MLNTTFSVKPFNNTQSLLSWTTTNSDDLSYIFVNGRLIVGSFKTASTARQLLIPIQISNGFIIEIHDFTAPDSSVLPITVPSNKLPVIAWESVLSAEKYKIYANDQLLFTIAAQADVKNYKKQITNTTFYGKIGTWHFFTVTAIDLYGNESLVKYFPHYVYDVPPLVSNIEVEEGSGAGLYNITITL